MIFFGVILGIVIMGAMVYLAVDKKSTFKMRLASLGAIAVMMISVIISLVVIFSDTTAPVDYSVLIVGAPPAEAEKDENSIFVIIFTVLFFLILLSVIIFLSMKEHKKQAAVIK